MSKVEAMKAHRTVRAAGTAILLTAVVVALSGCADGDTPVTPPPATTTVTATSTSTPSQSTASARVGTAPSTAAAAPPSAATGSNDSGSRSGACNTEHLSAELGQQDGREPGSGSGMSHQELSIILTNTGTAPCTVQGWPGVSFVGKGNGTQIGAAAKLNRSVPHPTVTLRQGASAQAYVYIEVAEAADVSVCHPTPADGLRVYPPGNRRSLFIKDLGSSNGHACASSSVDLLSVNAFIPNP
jgi:hypothetical protein